MSMVLQPSSIIQTDEEDLPECKVKRNYSCNTCDFFTQNPRHYLYHLRDVHGEKVRIYECPNCLYASRHFQKLLRHTKMVHNGGGLAPPPPKAPKLEAEAAAAPEEEEDLVSDAEDVSATVFKCSVCAFVAKSLAQLGRHERDEHIKTKFFRCTKCTYATHMKARFTKHVKYHSMPMIKCDMCDFRTPYKWNLDRHCKNHNGRGAFRCSACNFTADIKQSLTVHEMNHHVPPVGQAAGLGVGRRRNKVGASDATAAEEAAARHHDQVVEPTKPEIAKKTASKHHHQPLSGLHHQQESSGGSYGPDFIHPDDIVPHANGNVYIKNKCKLCNFKSAWAGEMAKHERKVHNIDNEPIKKKPVRPIPNLIPIPAQAPHKMKKSELEAAPSSEPVMSQADMNDICAKSANSTLKDLASLFDSEDVFTNNLSNEEEHTLPVYPSTKHDFKQKNASFFDKLKEKLMLNGGSNSNLNCTFCGHESKCLTAFAQHQKLCKEKRGNSQMARASFGSSRCQYCRQRCKSSADLYNHMQTCTEALKMLSMKEEDSDGELKIDESQSEDGDGAKPHPMENRVFVWNNIEVPMDLEVDTSKYEYTDRESDRVDDNVSLDLSVRTHSPCGGSESSFYISHNNNNNNNNTQMQLHHSPSITDKIPTHGNDITVAQHKRVFKCPHCSFWASTASRFHVHIVGHLNKKPFECSLCAYRSNWRWDITKHIKLKSVRDPAHESAKVLMTDETGRRNYTKYNKYLTEIHVSGNQSLETSGGSGTRPRNHDRNASPQSVKGDLPKLTRAPAGEFGGRAIRTTPLRPPPPLKAADGAYFKLEKSRRSGNAENKRTLFKCKKCDFRNPSREILLAHVKGHYAVQTAATGEESLSSNGSVPDVSMRGLSPDKDERHCRLKHSGDIRVVTNKNGLEKVEVEEQTDDPDHIDVPQEGTFKCPTCPYSSEDHIELEEHLLGHAPSADSVTKCHYCSFFVNKKEDLMDHLRLHGISDPEDFLQRINSPEGEASGKRFKCLICPYVTNSKSQYTYHKQFHKPRGAQYKCSHCTYNVSKRHLLHQHLKVHGINVTPQKQNGDVIDLDEISDEIEEVAAPTAPPSMLFDSQNMLDIPLVWVSKNEKFSKMFKCRWCPHVNLRKVNIQEHEKMHSLREKNPNSSRATDVEHRCTECNYVCNNAGVLSSHSKVHQGLYGTVHCLVDQEKSDEEQIRELSKFLYPVSVNLDDYENLKNTPMETGDEEGILVFCQECPARFLKETEYAIHAGLHGVRLFYKCEHCSYSARQKPHLLAHEKVHTLEYQERTRELLTMYPMQNQPPEVYANNEDIWLVSSDFDIDSVIAKPRVSLNVPLSGTELFQQKSEAQLKLSNSKEASPPSPKPADPQFGTLMHGNPNFIYPRYLKNGRMKEKRYKCHKCPSAFEKREQYKVHLNLHGSKQKYNCEHCDYSVKYYANYVQHLKKHQLNTEAQEAAIKSSPEDEEDDDIIEEVGDEPVALSLGDQQAYNILQQRLLVNSVSPEEEDAKKAAFNCPICPYVNTRKDAVDNHQKRHVSVSGVKSTYTCEHCDYSVPQVHFLKEHAKLHFIPNKSKVEGYMVCDSMKLVSANEGEQKLVFEENSVSGEVKKEFLPPLSDEVTERFNNNVGEKQFVNLETGDVVVENHSDSKMDES